jgi:hypothetical protein
MNIDSLLIARNGDGRVKLQPLAIAAGGARPGIEIIQLAQHDRPAILLAHLHIVAFQR